MPSSDCDNEPLREALRRLRLAVKRKDNKHAELALFTKELEQDGATKDLESVKSCAEVLELVGQLMDAGKTFGASIEALGKSMAMVTQYRIEDARAGNLDANRAERMRILNDALKIEAEEVLEQAEKARSLIDAYWECTERMAPRRIRLSLTMQCEEDFASLSWSYRLEMRCTGEAELVPDPDSPSDYSARLKYMLLDPSSILGNMNYQGAGELTLTVPMSEWTSSGPVSVVNATHEERGGPLTFHAWVGWSRHNPASLYIFVLESYGQMSLHFQGEVLVLGLEGQSFSGDWDIGHVSGFHLFGHVRGSGSRSLMRRPLIASSEPPHVWHAFHEIADQEVRSALDVTVSR